MEKKSVKLLLFIILLFSIPIRVHAQLPEWEGYQRTYTPGEETKEYKQAKEMLQKLQSEEATDETQKIYKKAHEEYFTNVINNMSGKYYNKYWNGYQWTSRLAYETVKVSYDVTYDYDEAYKMIDLVNEERRKVGVPELKTNDYLMQLAMERAAETKLYWSHTRPDGSNWDTKHMFIAGENNHSSGSAEEAFNSFKNSPKHYANMIDKSYKYAGYGILGDQGECVQIFVRGESFWDVGADQRDESKLIKVSDYPFTKSQTNYTETFTTWLNTDFWDQALFSNPGDTMISTIKGEQYISPYSHPEKLELGKKYVISPKGYFENLTPDIISVEKQSTENGVISLNSLEMTALAKGTAKFRTSLGGKSKEFEIEVTDGDGLEYKTSDGDIYVIKSTKNKTVNVKKMDDGNGWSVTIPDVVNIAGNTYKVVGIEDDAFKNSKISSVTIGNNITSIGNVFSGNNELGKVVLGNGVRTINSNSFKGCKNLYKITLGKNVTSIGKGAFSDCKKLRRIHIKSTKLKKVEKNAFKGIYKKLVIKAPKKKLKAYKKLFKKKNTGFKKTMKIEKYTKYDDFY